MRIACLQFAPQVGDVDNNLNRADAVLSRANPRDLDLLVLPELAFSGYNFSSLQHISPYLEPTTAGITSLWARTTALKYNCVVTAGYPEKVDVSPKWPTSPEYYNSAITVGRDGETIANYRKSFLYYTDETWALEGPDGFYDGMIESLGKNVAMGICMDLNPYKFEAPWKAWEFASHVLHREANLVILSMAWLTREDARSFSRTPKEPDMETLSYWLSRLEPLIREEGEEEIICVFANRTGIEGDAVYAGTSAVLGIQAGEVKVYGILGRGEKELLVVDTLRRPQMQLVSDSKQNGPAANARASNSSDSTANSQQSLSSDLAASIGGTSPDPIEDGYPADNCCFTPTSPVDSRLPQGFFGPEPSIVIAPHEAVTQVEKQREPSPVPESQKYAQPPSSESRNNSRSRGPALANSPILQLPDYSISDEIIDAPNTSESPIFVIENCHPAPTLHISGPSVPPILSEPALGNILSHEVGPNRTGLSRKHERPSHSTSADPSQPWQQDSFLNNSLGPRSCHISPRPKSTIW